MVRALASLFCLLSLFALPAPAEARDPVPALMKALDRIERKTRAHECEKAALDLAALQTRKAFAARMTQPASDPAAQHLARNGFEVGPTWTDAGRSRVLKCWFEVGNWRMVASFGLPQPQPVSGASTGSSEDYWSRGLTGTNLRARAYAVLAHTDVEPYSLLVERLGSAPKRDLNPGGGYAPSDAARERALVGTSNGGFPGAPSPLYFLPSLEWPIERYEALRDSSPAWLRAGAADCLERWHTFVTTRQGPVVDLERCMTKLVPSPEATASERRFRRARAERKAQADAKVRASIDQDIRTEIELNRCLPNKLLAMQSHIKALESDSFATMGLGTLHASEILVLNGSAARSVTVDLPGTYSVWALSADPVTIGITDPRGHSRTSREPGGFNMLQDGEMTALSVDADANDTIHVRLEGRGCTSMAIVYLPQ